MLSLGFLANTKQAEQYKNYKVSYYIQTFHNNKEKGTKITFWKFWLVGDFVQVWNFLSKNDWLILFHILTKDVIRKLRGGRIKNAIHLLGMNLEQ